VKFAAGSDSGSFLLRVVGVNSVRGVKFSLLCGVFSFDFAALHVHPSRWHFLKLATVLSPW
jgi:hypothetical protein